MDKQETLHIYTRVSSRQQAREDKVSLDDQERLGKEHADRLGYKWKVWREGDASASSDDLDKRPQMVAFLNDVKAGLVKHLYCYHINRLSRDDSEAQYLIRSALFGAKVVVHTASGIMDSATSAQKFLFGVQQLQANLEQADRTARLRRGRLGAVKNHYWHGGSAVFGFQVVDRKLVPHPEESKIVRLVFEMAAEGISLQKIQVKLLELGVQSSRGKKVVSLGSIRQMLKNTHPLGYYDYTCQQEEQTIRVPIEGTPIVSEKLAKRVRDRFKAGTRKQTKRKKFLYLLADFLMCGCCETRLAGRYTPPKNGVRKTSSANRYYCPKNERHWKKQAISASEKWTRKRLCENNRSLHRPSIDSLIWETVIATVSDSAVLKEAIKKEQLAKRWLEDAETVNRKASLATAQRKLQIKLATIQDAIEEAEVRFLMKEVDEKTHKGTCKRLLEFRDEVESALADCRIEERELEDQQQWIDWVKAYEHQYQLDRNSELSDAEKKDYLRGIVDTITVHLNEDNSHRLTVNYKLPIHLDSIKYIDTKSKPKKYEVADGNRAQILDGLNMRSPTHSGIKKKAQK